MKPLVGTTIGQYRLVEEVGRGGMAVVYRAFQPQLDRWVAVKILRSLHSLDEDALTRFRREATAIAALRHPNILTVYDYGRQAGMEYIVMEFVEGGTLRERLTGTPFEWRYAAKLAIGIAHALAHAHSHGIIHRDVKPANVLLPTEDWPLLADFGLVKIKPDNKMLTGPGVTLGTPAYTCPEQALGEPIDHRADIYALGVVLYQMLTGQVPFTSDKPFEIFLMHVDEPPPPPRRLVPNIPEGVEHIVLKSLKKHPDQRYQQMSQMIADLDLALQYPQASAAKKKKVKPLKTMELDSIAPHLHGPHFSIVGTQVAVPIPLEETILIGRTDPDQPTSVDIDLESYGGSSWGVSRHHALLVRKGKTNTLEDLNSTNGTFINNKRLTTGSPRKLKNGDSLRFGQLQLIFHSKGHVQNQ